jgi:hypothetical protein
VGEVQMTVPSMNWPPPMPRLRLPGNATNATLEYLTEVTIAVSATLADQP